MKGGHTPSMGSWQCISTLEDQAWGAAMHGMFDLVCHADPVPEDIMDDTDLNATNYLPISKSYVLEVAPEVDTISKVLELRDRDGEAVQ